jgi:tetratricopeptide (TPR) repeat protein
MSSTTAKCSSCLEEVEGDSAFCRHCGQRIPQITAEVQAVLDRTAAFSNPEGALDAIQEYLKRWPDSAEVRDVHLANQCVRLLLILVGVSKGKFPGFYQDVWPLADAAAAGLPTRLSNGLSTSARVADEAKSKRIMDAFLLSRQASAAILGASYDAAEKERQSLLVDGKTQAQIKKVTMEDSYRDAEIYYASYEKEEVEAALRGFIALKELQPTDAYFRNMLGSILLKQDKAVPALQEFLYGLALDPGDTNLTSNVLRCLCGLGLYPAAIEVLRHHEKIGEDPREPKLRGWGALARAVTAALIMKLAACVAEDVSAGARDPLDEFELPERPWLTEPEKSKEAEGVLRDARVFISYHHAGGLDFAQHLERALKGDCPSMRVFRDETFLIPGQDFVDQLRDEIDKADVFLALIDQNFVRGGRGGASGLHDRRDVLRREIARALEKERVIIPVLLEGAEMPGGEDVPDELKEFCELHALRLTEAGFARELVLLQEAMARLVEAKRLERQAAFKRFDEILELQKGDPEAAKRLLQPVLDQLPKYIERESVRGEGVPEASVELAGLWVCTATSPVGQVKAEFVTERTAGTPFSGEIRKIRGGITVFADRKREEIKGTWMPVMDHKKGLLLGLCLDGLRSGERFQLLIPFDRLLGADLVGTDVQGVTYSSRNVEPKRKGF